MWKYQSTPPPSPGTLTHPPANPSPTDHPQCISVNPLPHRDAFKHFCKQSRRRSGSSCKSYLIRVYSVCLWGNMIRYDPTLVNLTRNFFVPCTNVKVYLYIIIHSGWSLAWILMKEMVITYSPELQQNTWRRWRKGAKRFRILARIMYPRTSNASIWMRCSRWHSGLSLTWIFMKEMVITYSPELQQNTWRLWRKGAKRFRILTRSCIPELQTPVYEWDAKDRT